MNIYCFLFFEINSFGELFVGLFVCLFIPLFITYLCTGFLSVPVFVSIVLFVHINAYIYSHVHLLSGSFHSPLLSLSLINSVFFLTTYISLHSYLIVSINFCFLLGFKQSAY